MVPEAEKHSDFTDAQISGPKGPSGYPEGPWKPVVTTQYAETHAGSNHAASSEAHPQALVEGIDKKH